MITKAIVDTSHGELYLSKLCRHFAREVPAMLTRTQGRIEFTFGPCRIDVCDKQMHISIEVNDVHQASKAERVVTKQLSHISRKDKPDLQWKRHY